jgi:dienelactone hydrolase
MNPIMGTYHDMAVWLESHCARSLSFTDEHWADVESWRTQARGTVHRLLSYQPPACALDADMLESWERDGLVTERVGWAQPFGPRTEAFVVRPVGATGKLPGIVALHDHSDFKFYGKEKIVESRDEPPIMSEFKRGTYGGVSWANECARRGYVVVAPDVFLWGSRKMAADSIPARYVENVLAAQPGSRDFIEAYNRFSTDYESLIAKSLFLAGTTWPGVMAWEDRRAVDYLLTRADVDTTRLGCAGLSGGGLRTIYLAGLDPRIRCAVCVGFMSTGGEMLADVVRMHTWMFHVPHLAQLMDLPDVASLHGPLPLMVQYDRDDPLWALAGQEAAHEKLTRIFARMDAPAAYSGVFYPGPHKFDRDMQRDAFDWMDRWIG